MPFYDFNHTDYHELPLDYIMKLARESMGLKLKVVGDKLHLVNDLGQTLSSVTVSYSDTALSDTLGRDIKTYLLSVNNLNNQLVFTKGNGDVVYITPSFATAAEKDINNKNITDYVFNVTIVGDNLRVTKGDQTILDLTIPFATKSATDINSKDLTTYGASLTVNGNKIDLRDSMGRLLNSITVPYAEEAGLASNATNADHADDASHADEADEAELATLATLATDATNAVETVTISGNTMVFTTYGGQAYTITCPYSLKSLTDSLGNKISTTYITNVLQNAQTGKLEFYDAEGNVVAELLPTSAVAIKDSYNNLIADYIKSIAVNAGSDYVTITHGTGTVDTLVIQYSETALKDSQGSVIKNTYVTELECIEDVNDGHYKLVWYNNDNPKAEIGRCEVWAYKAQVDPNGRDLTSYAGEVSVDDNDSTKINVYTGDDTLVNQITGSVTSTPAGSISASASGTAVSLTSGTLPSMTYDSNTQYLEFAAGSFPAIDSVTDPSVTATFSGTASTDSVDFAD